MRDLKVIIGKIFNDTLNILGNILDSFLGITISYICLCVLVVTRNDNIYVSGILVLIYVGYVYRKIKQFLEDRKIRKSFEKKTKELKDEA